MTGQINNVTYCNQINPKLTYILEPIFTKNARFAKIENHIKVLNIFLETANITTETTADRASRNIVICISSTGLEKNILFYFHNPCKISSDCFLF